MIERFRELAAQLPADNQVRRASEALIQGHAHPEYVATGIRWMAEEVNARNDNQLVEV